jgi:hypothetical protein
MVTAFRFGLMVQSTEDIGKTTELMVRDASGMLTAIDLRGNSKMTNQTARELTLAKTGPFIKVCGLMMFSMDRVRHSGRTDLVL